VRSRSVSTTVDGEFSCPSGNKHLYEWHGCEIPSILRKATQTFKTQESGPCTSRLAAQVIDESTAVHLQSTSDGYTKFINTKSTDLKHALTVWTSLDMLAVLCFQVQRQIAAVWELCQLDKFIRPLQTQEISKPCKLLREDQQQDRQGSQVCSQEQLQF
jgi:hypothetical protein